MKNQQINKHFLNRQINQVVKKYFLMIKGKSIKKNKSIKYIPKDKIY